MDRREFLTSTAAGIAIGQINNAQAVQPQAPVVVKDAGLKVISADPLVLETPDRLLAANRITPSTSLFVRNHHGAKHLEDLQPRPLEGDLEISGLIDKPTRFPLAELAKLPKTEVEMVLQCSGNFRFEFSKLSPIKGTPWNKGGIGNVRFAGVRFSDFLKAAGVVVSAEAKFATAEGADQPEKAGQVDYEKSVPLEVLVAKGILATELNGAALPAVHGGPLRLVIPGYYGNVQVKWLTRLRFESKETSNFFQIPDYRTPKQRVAPGTAIEYTFDNSDPNFDMKINSRIFAPVDGATVPSATKVELRGVAWNDGSADLVAVEFSKDRGATWRTASLGASAGPYAFREWSGVESFDRGEQTLWVRAVDALGRSQPIDGGLFWNPGGYGWNAIEKIVLTAV
jgi:sulfite oxidase